MTTASHDEYFLWFGLAVATAFKMMSAAPAPKAPTEAG